MKNRPVHFGSSTLAAHDRDANRIQIAKSLLPKDPAKRRKWMQENGITPVVEGGAYSLFEMAQPFQQTDGTAVANVASLDPTTAKSLTVTAQPSLATGSITCRDSFSVAMN